MKQKSKKSGKSLTGTALMDKGAVKLNVDFHQAMQLLANAANRKTQQRLAANKK